jgi:hypothetical protein
MKLVQVFARHVETALLLVLCAGLLRRRRAALCWSFLAYALAVVCANQVAPFLEYVDWSFDANVFKETALFVLKVLVALEIWQRTFATFPRARVQVGGLLAIALLLLAGSVQVAPSERDQWDLFIGVVTPRLQFGALALYLIVVSAAGWYRVPLHEFHRAVLLGFAAYLVVHALTYAYLGWNGGTPRSYHLSYPFNLGGYLATVVWWSWAAWRPVRAPSPILSRLQPWARSR